MEEKKDSKAPRKRGLVASMIGGGKKDPSKDKKEEPRKADPKEDKKAAAKKREEEKALKRKRADDRKNKQIREEKEKAAKEKAQANKEKAVKAKSEKAEKERKDELRNGEFRVLTTESGDFETTFNKMYLNRKPWEEENPKNIVSFMPGTVGEIKVSKGDQVKEGDILMIFRAMKMNNQMLAPADGKVKAINVKEGENIPKNVIMMELS